MSGWSVSLRHELIGGSGRVKISFRSTRGTIPVTGTCSLFVLPVSLRYEHGPQGTDRDNRLRSLEADGPETEEAQPGRCPQMGGTGGGSSRLVRGGMPETPAETAP
jgi:hypothetical protein